MGQCGTPVAYPGLPRGGVGVVQLAVAYAEAPMRRARALGLRVCQPRHLARLAAVLGVLVFLGVACRPDIPAEYTVLVDNRSGGVLDQFEVRWGDASFSGSAVLPGQSRFTDPAWTGPVPADCSLTWQVAGAAVQCVTITIPPDTVNRHTSNWSIVIKPDGVTCRAVEPADPGPGARFTAPLPVTPCAP